MKHELSGSRMLSDTFQVSFFLSKRHNYLDINIIFININILLEVLVLK